MTILKGVSINYLGQVSRLRSTSTYPPCLIRKFNPKCGSQLAPGRIEKVEDAVKVGDEIMVKVVEIDSQGRMNLSRKAVLNGGDVEDYVVARPPRGNGPFGGGGGGGGDRDGGDRPRRRRD